MSAKKTERKNSILILGIGNILMGDDGIGIHAIHELEKLPLAEGITLMDGGTGGLNLYEAIVSHKKVIIVDAIDLKETAGKIKRIDLKEVKLLLDETHCSMHQNSITEPIKLAESLGKCPKIVIFGIQPGKIEAGLELSAELQRILPDIVNQVLHELA